VPRGSLAGSFAASPAGHAGASGAPATAAGATGPGGHGVAADDPLSGISISGTAAATPLPVVASAAPRALPALPAVDTLAPLRRSAAADLARNPAASAAGDSDTSDLFRARRSYSMAVNMPNLSSVSGSWIIHFAELRGVPVSAPGLVPPAMVLKADPAYPSDLMRDGVQGTVVLYAVIHSDGSVGSVRVMEGVNERLDHYAEVALTECRFKPAMRNGAPVELEAVVQIPFRSERSR
ncbi:MAG TPA: energy transducer TonB, partial [Terriglobales bacterium]|nr:energy transducer TonB [Terriglobales bacterium]